MKRRSKLEIYVEVLMVLSDSPKNLTRLMYATNMSWTPLKACLHLLIEQGMAKEYEKGAGRKSYAITEKGLAVVNMYKELMTLVKFS